MPLPYRRADRVGEQIQRELSQLLLREVKDPRLDQVTITAVELTPDLKHARVFFAGLADATGRAAALAGLTRAAGFLRGQVGRNLRLKYAPEFSFIADDSIDRGLRIAALLKEVAPKDADG
jgi:ribosome-binding factor A